MVEPDKADRAADHILALAEADRAVALHREPQVEPDREDRIVVDRDWLAPQDRAADHKGWQPVADRVSARRELAERDRAAAPAVHMAFPAEQHKREVFPARSFFPFSYPDSPRS